MVWKLKLRLQHEGLQQHYPSRGDVNHALAIALIRQDKDGEAIVSKVKAEPRNAAYLVNLARLYLKYEVVENALPLSKNKIQIPITLQSLQEGTG